MSNRAINTLASRRLQIREDLTRTEQAIERLRADLGHSKGWREGLLREAADIDRALEALKALEDECEKPSTL